MWFHFDGVTAASAITFRVEAAGSSIKIIFAIIAFTIKTLANFWMVESFRSRVANVLFNLVAVPTFYFGTVKMSIITTTFIVVQDRNIIPSFT